MINRIAFFNRLTTQNLYQKPLEHQKQGLNAILDEWEGQGLTDLRWLAYMLATAYHETAKTIQPIEEYGKGKSKPYGSKIKYTGGTYDGDHIYYGRGLVQLTWYENYKAFGEKLGIDLLNFPEYCCSMPVAIKVMFKGMIEGLFTGVSLKRYFNETTEDWINARKIINGKDKAELIAVYAKKFYECIK